MCLLCVVLRVTVVQSVGSACARLIFFEQTAFILPLMDAAFALIVFCNFWCG